MWIVGSFVAITEWISSWSGLPFGGAAFFTVIIFLIFWAAVMELCFRIDANFEHSVRSWLGPKK